MTFTCFRSRNLFTCSSWLLLSNSHLLKSTCYFILKRFYSLKNKRDTAPFLITSSVIFFLKFRLQMRCSVEFLTLSRKSTFAIFTICQKNNCSRSTALLFGLGRTTITKLYMYSRLVSVTLCFGLLLFQTKILANSVNVNWKITMGC